MTDRRILGALAVLALGGAVVALLYLRPDATEAAAPDARAPDGASAPDPLRADPAGTPRPAAGPDGPRTALDPETAAPLPEQLAEAVQPFAPGAVGPDAPPPDAYLVRGPDGTQFDLAATLARIAGGEAGAGLPFVPPAGGLLPKPEGYYRQYPCGDGTEPSAQRVVLGEQDEAWYTPDGVRFTQLTRWRGR